MSSDLNQLAYARPRRTNRTWPRQRRRGRLLEFLHSLGTVLAWGLGTLFLIGLPMGGIIALVGPIAGYPCIMLAVVMIPTLAMMSRSVRRRRAAATLGYLQQAIRLNLPLNRFLSAAARSETGRLSRSIAELELELQSGARLAVALAIAVPEMPDRTIALIDYAEQVGRLPETLDRLVLEQVGESRKLREARTLEFWYPPILLLVAGAVGSTLSIFVFPKFAAILTDFHVPMPALSRWVFASADWIMLILPVLLVAIVAVLGVWFHEAIRPVRPSWLYRGIRDRVLWMLPISHGLVRDRAMTDICSALADSVELGYPLDRALDRAQQLELNLVIKQRVKLWAEGVTRGLSPGEAARKANMPILLVGMLGSAQAASGMGEVFKFLSRFYSGRFVLRRELVRGAYLPAATLVMGLVVALVALALFLPIQELVEISAKRGP